eukprot:5948961-Heterocapsa_arctica.AAC.1
MARRRSGLRKERAEGESRSRETAGKPAAREAASEPESRQARGAGRGRPARPKPTCSSSLKREATQCFLMTARDAQVVWPRVPVVCRIRSAAAPSRWALSPIARSLRRLALPRARAVRLGSGACNKPWRAWERGVPWRRARPAEAMRL